MNANNPEVKQKFKYFLDTAKLLSKAEYDRLTIIDDRLYKQGLL